MKDSSSGSPDHDGANHTGDVVISFGGEDLVLLPERAAWWPKLQTLFIADTHFGKDACFRAVGVPIPSVLHSDLARLSEVIDRTRVRQLVVLGDLLHARDGRSAAVIDEVTRWRAQVPSLQIVLVRGNHDWHAGDPPEDWRVECIDAPGYFDAMQVAHVPTFRESAPTLAGHLHPKIRLQRSGDTLQLFCFFCRGNTLVLPAFSSFVDHGVVSATPGDAVYVVAGSQVLRV